MQTIDEVKVCYRVAVVCATVMAKGEFFDTAYWC